jgi:heme-degrading monooxygenase HmoA
MFAVVFEVQPKPENFDEYLGLAKFLKPELKKIDGFIDNERFACLSDKGRVLSLSTWRDEKSLVRWRTLAVHHEVQEKGRFKVFEDYHLRVGEITLDTQLAPGEVLPAHRFDETEIGAAKIVTLSELSPVNGGSIAAGELGDALGLPKTARQGAVSQKCFESIYNPGKLLLLVAWQDAAAAGRWKPGGITGFQLRHRRIRVIRDYGMFDRREAPQYYPAVVIDN